VTKPTPKSDIRTFINPVIVSQNEPDMRRDQKNDSLEGCLSIPNIWGHVHRSDSLVLTYQDETGQSHTEQFDGFEATIVQHETDHVNGILYTRRVIEQNGKLYQTGYEDGKEVLQEIKLR
jgi:peptide deformylase